MSIITRWHKWPVLGGGCEPRTSIYGNMLSRSTRHLPDWRMSCLVSTDIYLRESLFYLQVTDKVFFKIAIGGKEIAKEIEIGLFGGTVPKTVANFKVM